MDSSTTNFFQEYPQPHEYDDRITNLFELALSPRLNSSVEEFNHILYSDLDSFEKAKKLEKYLPDASISPSIKEALLNHLDIIGFIDETILCETFLSIPNLSECQLRPIGRSLSSEKNIKQFINYCWDYNNIPILKEFRFSQLAIYELIEERMAKPENLLKALFVVLDFYNTIDPQYLTTLLDQYGSLDRILNVSVQQEAKQGLIDKNVSRHLDLLTDETKRELLTLLREEGNHPVTKLFLSNPTVVEYIFFRADLTPEDFDFLVEKDFLNSVHAGSDFHAHFDASPSSLMPFIKGWIHAKNSTNIFNSAIAASVEYLDQKSLDILNVKIDQWLDDPDLHGAQVARLNQFIAQTEKYSLFLWKRRFPKETQNVIQIAKGSQEGKDGPVNTADSTQIVRTLKKLAPPSVQFNKNKVYPDLLGGTCSAMTLSFLANYLEQRKKSASALEAIETIAPEHTSSSEKFRTTQMAYNTIERKRESDDFKKDKIEALLQLELPYSSIERTSANLDINNPEAKEDVEFLYNHLPDGEYVVRTLHISEGEEFLRIKFGPAETKGSKEEEYGHSTLFIKENDRYYYYDPATGPLELTHPSQLYTILSWQNHRWSIPLTRFYKVGS